MNVDFDLLVVGGGINGAAIARDAAGRGARVLLVERDDLAGHTSSASTKLIHGGLRYLEHFEFRLVAEALAERERLISSAPHLIRPLQFVVPHDRQMRPAWMIHIGLFLYDHLGGRRKLPGSASVRLDGSGLGDGLQRRFKRAFSYWDCFGDDSRLVVANAKDAAERGATILTRTNFIGAQRHGSIWTAQIEDCNNGKRQTVTAHALINAAGSWAGGILSDTLNRLKPSPLRLVRGSHIVTRRLFVGDHAYVLQNPDRRIVFVIPYERELSLIGTTDVAWEGEPDNVYVDPTEVAYLCETVNGSLRVQITPEDVVWSYAGLRALYDDEANNPSAVSRDYVLKVDGGPAVAPVLSVFGGKITTHRALAEAATNKLSPYLAHMGQVWTGDSKLPGGDIPSGNFAKFAAEFAREASFLPTPTAQRWAQAYGSRAYQVLGTARSLRALGEEFGAGLTEAEVDYLVNEEWAIEAEDILWRRSKLGLHIPAEGANKLTRYLGQVGSRLDQSKQELGAKSYQS